MEEQLSLLVQLQEMDMNIRVCAEQKKRLPGMLAALESRRAASKADVDKMNDLLQTAQKDKRDRDADLAAGVQKVEKLRARSSEIKNNKEYQALLKEIQSAEEENKAIEDDILVLMEKIDAAAAQITVAEQHAKEEEQAILGEQEQQKAAFARFDEELKELDQARSAVLAKIQPSVFDKYQRIAVAKAGLAMAEARGESCMGCYMSIPPQVFVNVKKNNSIITCPHCNRILYVKETIGEKIGSQ